MTKYDQSKHYTTATCSDCGEEYKKYYSLQTKCPDCSSKLMAFLITKNLRDKLDTLPKNTKSKFVREAIEEKFERGDK